VDDNGFTSLHDSKINNIGKTYCGTITARYYKGIGGSSDGLVLEKLENE